jgi:hypothetical protein
MPTVTADTTGVLIFPKNKLRRSFSIQNTDTAINVFVGRQPIGTLSSTVFDIRLTAGQTVTLNATLDGAPQIQDRWNVVAASGNPIVAWFETESFDREAGKFVRGEEA